MTIFRNLVARCQSPEAEFIAVKCNIPRKFSALTNGQFDKLMNDMKMYLSDCAESGNPFPIEFDKVWRWVGYSHKSSAYRALRQLEMDQELKFEPKKKAKQKQLKKPITMSFLSDNKLIQRYKIFLSLKCFRQFCFVVETTQGKTLRKPILQVLDKLNASNGVAAPTSEQIPEQIPEVNLEQISEIPEPIPEQIPEENLEQISEQIPEPITEPIPEQIPEENLEQNPEQNSEQISHKRPAEATNDDSESDRAYKRQLQELDIKQKEQAIAVRQQEIESTAINIQSQRFLLKVVEQNVNSQLHYTELQRQIRAPYPSLGLLGPNPINFFQIFLHRNSMLLQAFS